MRKAVNILLSVVPSLGLVGEPDLSAETFTGTNPPGGITSFSFSVGASATNLSLVISNAPGAYSHLWLAKGRVPAESDFDFVSRLDGAANQINLEIPEFSSPTNYGLLVSTPAASAAHSFEVQLATNRTDLRSSVHPVLKPLAFTTTGTLTNPAGAGVFHYFQVDAPTNLPGWRLVLSTTNKDSDLYIRRGALPTTSAFDQRSTGQPVDTVVFNEAEAIAGTYFIGVYLPAGPATNSVYALTTEVGWLNRLTWDPGTSDTGTEVYTNTSASGGDYYFQITPQAAANGVWRSVLRVISGEADLYARRNAPAQTNSYSYASTRTGSDGFVLAQTAQWAPGQNWYLTVHASPGAQWTLLTGEAYVEPLPDLAADSSSGASAVIGPEGMRFFKTTISPDTAAWRLGLSGANNTLLVHQTKAPLLYGSAGGGYYDWSGHGQLLLVPPYVQVGSQYFIGIVGAPGLAIDLDSRQQPVSDLAFNSATNAAATDYGYLTFRVQVPVRQIAWQINLTPASGDASMAVRRDNVPNEYTNDAFSEITGSVADSLTLVPPGLSDGTFYLTVYGQPPYTCLLTSGDPVITDVPYVFEITNDAPARSGWRFYRVANTAEQLGTYGWDLELTNFMPGTEIAIRRNAVPSRWNYRHCTANCTSSSSRSYLDYSGIGFLQRPGHQADIWYIGVNQPTTALGDFVLTGQELTGVPLSSDGTDSSRSVTNQPAGKWQYYVFNIPSNLFGWDLRLTHITSGDPRLAVCRDQLPYDLANRSSAGGGWYYPYTSGSWPSGNSWAPATDWTGYSYDPDGLYYYGKLLAMGRGNPLEPGVYYVGVIGGNGAAPLSYSLVSRGIGASLAIPVTDLPFAGGVAFSNRLPAREAAYYHVQIPDNTPSWKLRLAVTNGEALMLVQKDSLPNIAGASSSSTSLGGGRRMQKAGDEHYLLLPTTTAPTNIPAGDYYIAVVSEGLDPHSSFIGTNGCAFVLTSVGAEPTNQIGNLTASGPDLSLADTLAGGEVKHYQFTVSTGVLAMEVRLDNRTANPRMTLRSDGLLVRSSSSYGRDAGQNYDWLDNNGIINIAAPQPGTYTLAVQADSYSGGYSNATYEVTVHALSASPLAFDGGATTVTFHSNGVWRYFSVDVPADAFGWDVRLTNTTGSPRLVVRRVLAPSSLSTLAYYGGWYYPWTSTDWPSGNQWAAGSDWTGYSYDADGTSRTGHILAMGTGNPLEPGHYYVGVFSATPTSAGYMNYTLVSRGIGTNQAVAIHDLQFLGSVSGTNIPPREAVYYRVQVPVGMPSWKLRLVPTNSEAMMIVQKDYLPNVGAGNSSPVRVAGGRSLQKSGNEQFTLLPRTSEATITNGTYYIAVVSEGVNPHSSYAGSNSCSYTLYSLGPAPTNDLGIVDASGMSDLTFDDELEGGEFKFYRFTVPPGTLSLEVHLENRVANPYMSLRADDDLPRPLDSYGYSDGHADTWNDDTLINLTSPTPTNYTLCVQARYSSGSYPDASYTIRLHALGISPVVFDGGTHRINDQPAGVWQYFVVTVPPTAVGWDLRLTNISSGYPRLVVRRDALPDNLSTHADAGGWYYPQTSTSWPSGYQWAAGGDGTGYSYDSDGTYTYGTLLAAGMGNPLSPGTYHVGVINGSGSSPMSYTLVSRGIGAGFSIPVRDLSFVGSVSSNGLPARETAYYRVSVPAGERNWKLRLARTSGDALLMLQKDYLPNISAGNNTPTGVYGGRKLQKSGDEQYLLLPAAGQPTIPGGTYYVAVTSEGMNPVGSRIGSNACNFTLTSSGSLAYTDLGDVGSVDHVRADALAAGEINLYQFTATNSPAIEVRLDNETGNSYLRLVLNSNAPSGRYGYGYNDGENATWQDDRIITLPNASAGLYSLNVQADPNNVDAAYTLVVRQIAPLDLAFDPTLATSSVTNVASGTLSDLQRAYFRVVVPATFNGQPVLGWKLTLDHTLGNPRLRVRKDLLPADQGYVGDSPYNYNQMAIVPPFLTAGTWYVEVQGQGASQFTLSSSVLLPERPAWNMPPIGGSVTSPGLPPGGPVFGDTGVDTNGVALAGDQGTDLEQGRFHYYAIVVPANNAGVFRTRLDAISGDPNLYLRAGDAPTLSHYLNGDNGALLYNRSLTANVGSEYGNWVPIDGREELQLTPGVWYLAVQAGGDSNVRYRLLVSLGLISNLAYDGMPLIGQTLAAGDWRYYHVFIPTNAFTAWQVTFAQTLGDVVMYVRDTTPPGQGSRATDYRHWQGDNKNFGPYASYDSPGTYPLTTPPLRPGNDYYLGFRAVNDATFSVSCTTNADVIDCTNVIAFYGGSVTNVIPPNGAMKYRVSVPSDARRWVHTSMHSNTVAVYLEQGTIPQLPSQYHWTSGTAADSALNRQLYNTSWPWRPGYLYFILATNQSAVPQQFVLNLNGKNAATDDYDDDGLPDEWELTYWPSIYSYNRTDDADHDGVENGDEYAEDTDPADPADFHPRLTINTQFGIVTRNPAQPWYTLGQSVQLAATPDPGYGFLGWSGDAFGPDNPLDLVMDTNKSLTAIFGITNNSGADYQFQLSLSSSVGSPPDLQNIGAGNIYVSDTVDTCSRIVLQFPLHNGLQLQPTTGVIPTNVYTIVMLFRLDQTDGYRRLIDFRSGTSANGLYVYNGRLHFYPRAGAPASTISAGSYVQVVLTHDGTNVAGYVNGVPQFEFVDSANDAVLTSASDLRFFKDNGTVQESGGTVARIRLYDQAMPAAQVAFLDRTDCGGVPHFLTPFFHTNTLHLPVESVIPGVAYRLQASTNLVQWLNIQTGTPPANPTLFVDPAATNYPQRFYRLVTP